jgi:branched-chain amino acid transport system substrate-binding protein
MDAISAARSTEASKVNQAIGRTDKTYVVGPVKFDAEHTSKLPIAELQWQAGETRVVWPANRATARLPSAWDNCTGSAPFGHDHLGRPAPRRSSA